MNDREKFQVLQDRLRSLEHTTVAPWQRAIHAVSLRALEAEIADLGRRIATRGRRGSRRAAG